MTFVFCFPNCAKYGKSTDEILLFSFSKDAKINLHNIKTYALTGSIIVALIVFTTLILFENEDEGLTPTGRQYTYDYMLQSFNPDALGTGVETTGDVNVKQPMACALIAKAAALKHDKAVVTDAADCLLQTRSTGNGIGWGLGWAWDAFGDGSKNSADTVYGITTSLAVDGLISAYGVTGLNKYKTAAMAALDYYAKFTKLEQGNYYFWYSDKPEDAKNVYNVNAMIAGTFADAGQQFNRKDFQNIALKVIKTVIADAISKNDDYTWRYGDIERSRFNDVLHAAYIVYGIARVQQVTGTVLLDQSRMINYLSSFNSNDGLLEFRPSEIANAKNRRARGWGLGMAAYVLAHLGDIKMANALIAQLKDYEYAAKEFSYIFGDKLNVPRSNAHILLALAALETVTSR